MTCGLACIFHASHETPTNRGTGILPVPQVGPAPHAQDARATLFGCESFGLGACGDG